MTAPLFAYAPDTSFLDSHAPAGLWEDGVVDEFESGDVFGVDPYAHFGGFIVGGKRTKKRNQAFEVLKKVSAAIGFARPFSANAFRGMSLHQANLARGKVAKALKDYAKNSGIKLTNPLDPLATYSTANKNLGKVIEAGGVTAGPRADEGTEALSTYVDTIVDAPPGSIPPPGLFTPPAGHQDISWQQQGMTVAPPNYQTQTIDQQTSPETPKPLWKNPWVWAAALGLGGVGVVAVLMMRK